LQLLLTTSTERRWIVSSIAFAKTSPDIQCEILDIPEVVPLSAEYINKAGVSA